MKKKILIRKYKIERQFTGNKAEQESGAHRQKTQLMDDETIDQKASQFHKPFDCLIQHDNPSVNK